MRSATILCAFAAATFGTGSAVGAQSLTYLSGVVEIAGKPVPGVTVKLAGNNLTQSATTDVHGHYSFNVSLGEYQISVVSGKEHALREVHVSPGGTTVDLDLTELREIGRAVVSHASDLKASGTDVVIDSTQLSKLPGGNSLPNVLVTLPDAARGSNGQIHINGDHNGINYIVDGVQLPEGLNRVLGNEIDPSDIQSIDVLEGAYPAQYGDHFAAQLNISTKARTGPAGYDESFRVGSFDTFDDTFDAHAPLGTRGSITFAGRLEQDGHAIDPPEENAPHDFGSTSNELMRVTLPVGAQDNVNLDLIHSTQTFQIPPDTTDGFPSNQDDNEVQDDNFASLQYHHSFSPETVVSFGPSYKNSRLLDTPDLAADLKGAAGSNCTDFSDCQFYSVLADRVSQDTRFNVDFITHTAANDVHAGMLITRDSIPKLYEISLQPGNELSQTGGIFTATDDNLNRAYQQEAYIQDSLLLERRLHLDAGARYDAFEIGSSDFNSAFRQISPRIKLTQDIGAHASVYAYYGRLFAPFSFENVDPKTAAMLYTAADQPNAGFDLKPQRDSLYETGFHMPLGNGDLGFRLSHKVATDYLDDTQVGSTNLHQDINFPRGQVNSQSVYITEPLPRQSRVYVSISHVVAQNSLNCETQLLQNCSLDGPPGGDFVQSDHDQHYDLTSGLILNDTRGDYFSMTGEYGSGLSRGDTTVCPDSNMVNCKVPPHLTFDASQSVLLGEKATSKTFLTFGIENLFDDDYAETLDSTLQGTHFARPRTFFMSFATGH